jgi:NAD(P)-dependent dehydrogenase (short-subunit alcohol dehydrogenase family)
MSLFDAFSYRGRRVLVVGGATGMGNATARLALDAGAEVVVMDYASSDLPGTTAIRVNLADAKSIDAAVTECGGTVDALFSCAGVADGEGIERINPGPTDTPLAQANAELWLDFGADYRAKVGIGAATPMEQAYPLLFLCSDAAVVVNGITLVTDSGYLSAAITEAFPAGAPMAKLLLDGSPR